MTRAETKTERFLISGFVQGVGFRAYVAREADRLGVKGWVRNRGVDQVEAVLSGAPHALDALALKAATGPAGARVRDLQRASASPDLLSASGDAAGCVVLPSV